MVSLILALGPTLHWAGQQIHVTVWPGLMALLDRVHFTSYLSSRLDSALLQDMQHNHYLFVPLPMLLLYLFVPFTASMRAVARFGVVTVLAVATLAGYGVALLAARWNSRFRQTVFTGLLCGGILFELLALPNQTTALEPRPVDLWLAQQPKGAVVEMPIQESVQPLQRYYATVHQQPSVLGPTGMSFTPATLSERRERLKSFPDADSLAALREYQAAYILVQTDRFEDWPKKAVPWEATGELELIRCFGSLCVYGPGR